MEFQVGDQVVHPFHGVGTVKSITEQQFVGAKAYPYYEVVNGGLTVWIPVGTPGSTGLRSITTKASLEGCRSLLTSAPIPLDKNFRIRQIEIEARLKDGSFPARCAMVRDLTAQSRLRPLTANEDALLKRILTAVCDEWAASDGVSNLTALHEIEGLLQEGHPHEVREAEVRKRTDRQFGGW